MVPFVKNNEIEKVRRKIFQPTVLRTLQLTNISDHNIRFLKVANQWVAGVPHDPHCTAIARGAIGLSAGLGTLSLAEGVETKEQLRGLKQFGCSLAQGFFFSEPVPTQAVPALMKRSWKF